MAYLVDAAAANGTTDSLMTKAADLDREARRFHQRRRDAVLTKAHRGGCPDVAALKADSGPAGHLDAYLRHLCESGPLTMDERDVAVAAYERYQPTGGHFSPATLAKGAFLAGGEADAEDVARWAALLSHPSGSIRDAAERAATAAGIRLRDMYREFNVFGGQQ